MGIRENIESIRAELEQELQRLDDVKQLEEARQRVLGKKGSLTALLRSMGQLSPEERPAAGQMINAGRERISAMLDERLTTLKARERERKLEREALDVTRAARPAAPGRGASYLAGAGRGALGPDGSGL